MESDFSESTVVNEQAEPRTLRELWQFPMLVLGVLASLVVLFVKPRLQDKASVQLRQEFTQVRQLLSGTPEEVQQARLLAESLLGKCEGQPKHAGEAAYLFGSAQLKVTSKLSAPTVEDYQAARFYLERARTLGVPKEDEASLLAKLGRTYYFTNEAADKTITVLSHDLTESKEDLVEVYVILTQCYLKLPTPDYHAALEANLKLLNLPTVPEEVLPTARLMRGELLLALKKPEEARKALETVRAPAPTGLLVRAKQLLAHTYQDEERWADAARVWTELTAQNPPTAELTRILCHLGACYRQLGKMEEARSAWEKALEKATGEEEQAAALGLAELQMLREPSEALPTFERVVRSVKQPGEWRNALIPLLRAQERFEWAWEVCVQGQQYSLASKLAQIYQRIAPVGKAQLLQAQAAEQWAKKRSAGPKADTPLEAQAIADLYQQAGEHYLAAAQGLLQPADRTDRILLSVQANVQGRNLSAAESALTQLASAAEPSEKLAEAWYRLGDKHLQQKTQVTGDAARKAASEAERAFAEATKQPGKFSNRARYKLAMCKVANGDFDGAVDDLKKNQTLLASEMDREAHENTLFELASLLFHRRDYRQAASRLQNALQLYKDSPRAKGARYLYAECYRNLADQAVSYLKTVGKRDSEARDHYQKQYEKSLDEAGAIYQDLAEELAIKLTARQANSEEEALYRAAMFASAECRYLRGHYQEARTLYQELTNLCHNRVERLHALAGQRQCYYAMSDPAQAQAILGEMAKSLETLPLDAFQPESSKWTREQWQDWLTKERQNDAKPVLNLSNLQGGYPAGLPRAGSQLR